MTYPSIAEIKLAARKASQGSPLSYNQALNEESRKHGFKTFAALKATIPAAVFSAGMPRVAKMLDGWSTEVSAEVQQILGKWLRSPGFFVIGGATGSGRTSLMSAALNDVLDQDRNLKVDAISDFKEFDLTDGGKRKQVRHHQVNALDPENVRAVIGTRHPDIISLSDIDQPLGDMASGALVQAVSMGKTCCATAIGANAPNVVYRLSQMLDNPVFMQENFLGCIHLHRTQMNDSVYFEANVRYGKL